MFEETTPNAEYPLIHMDRFAAYETLWNYQQQLERTLQELNDRSENVINLTISAIACAAAWREFPSHGDEKVEKLFDDFQDECTYDEEEGIYAFPKELMKKHAASGARGVKLAKNTVDAALKCLEALIAADEPLANFSDNLHPVQLAQRINKLGIALFRGRVIGLPE